MYADFYHQQLVGSGKLDWLVRDRKISLKAIKAFKLGYVGKPAVEDHERFVGCVSIPYFDANDHERSIRFRTFRDHPKYLSQSGDEPHLFAVRYSEEPKVFVTEGEIDAVTLWMTGRKAVGVPGAQTWKPSWKWLFRNCEEVVVVFDGDDSGKVGQAKIMRDLGQTCYARGVEMPAGMDVNDLFRKSRKHLEALLG